MVSYDVILPFQERSLYCMAISFTVGILIREKWTYCNANLSINIIKRRRSYNIHKFCDRKKSRSTYHRIYVCISRRIILFILFLFELKYISFNFPREVPIFSRRCTVTDSCKMKFLVSNCNNIFFKLI